MAQLIAARVTSDNIYASIGRLGMQKANDSGADLSSRNPQSIKTKPPAQKQWQKLVRTLE